MCIMHNNDICRVMSVTHRTPGNLRAFVQVRMRNLKNGNSFDHRFSSTEGVDRAILDTHPMEYLYSDPSGHHFMNQGNYDQVALTDEVLGDALLYLLPNMVITVDFYEENAWASSCRTPSPSPSPTPSPA
jgi:elongation factor P